MRKESKGGCTLVFWHFPSPPLLWSLCLQLSWERTVNILPVFLKFPDS